MPTAQITAYLPGLMDFFQQSTNVKVQAYCKQLVRTRQEAIVANKSLDLCTLLAGNIKDNRPWAQVSAKVDGLPEAHWLRVDPVCLQVDLVHVYQLGSTDLLLNADEIHQVVLLLKPLLDSYQLELQIPHPERWYLRGNDLPVVDMQNPETLLGMSITDFLPRDTEFWAKLFTEIQMLLHNSEINQSRQRLGLATIDALWFWGQGHSDQAQSDQDFVGIISDDVFFRKLAEEVGLQSLTIEAWLNTKVQQHWLFYSAYFRQKNTILPAFLSALLEQKFSLQLYPDNKHCYHVTTKFSSWWQRFRMKRNHPS